MLRTRTLSALVLVPLLAVALWIGMPAIAAVLAVAAFLGALEVYRLLAQRFHPDNHETGSEAKFRQIHEAYSVLSDPEKRQKTAGLPTLIPSPCSV